MLNPIEIIDLKKKYGDILAVDGLNFNVSQGSFFRLLDPNGAGKTGTIFILSTILPLTSGIAKIFGMDLGKQTKNIKSMIGICPQELALYDRLTARENIHLITQMRGLSKNDYKEQTEIEQDESFLVQILFNKIGDSLFH
ncbi:MAG: ATP-binding cassette domain-containing protein [Candidatus Lokiarchaeota archaeon]|nr:ATP-binding cassette domain-containing protein [Candidatus Lokiarchaeota archaeon]